MAKTNGMSFGKGLNMNLGKGVSMGKGKGSNNITLTGIILISAVFIFAILIANRQQIQETFFSEKRYSFEYYYMDTCGHCRVFNSKGIWEKLNTHTFNNVSLKKYDREDHKERVKSLGITGFPAFIMVDNTATAGAGASTGTPTILASFEEERTYENILKFIKNYE
uniref:Thioredoxin domain-containing protein n=1 Tax=viral metagenome TaxID=1070528 RepID=A0A6C0KAF0_9ZZZZ